MQTRCAQGETSLCKRGWIVFSQSPRILLLGAALHYQQQHKHQQNGYLHDCCVNTTATLLHEC